MNSSMISPSKSTSDTARRRWRATTRRTLISPRRRGTTLAKAEKEANRAQARAIHDKLDLYDLYVVAADHPEAQVLMWSKDQVQRLARVEHDRRMLQKS